MWIAFLDHLAYNIDSFWHRQSVIAKVFFLTTVVFSVIISRNIYFLVGLFILLIFFMAISSLPVFTLSLLLLYPLFFGLVFAASKVGEAAAFPFITPIRAVVAATVVIFVISTTYYFSLFAIVQNVLGMFIGDVMFASYRSFFIVLDSIINSINIARIRGSYSFFSIIKNLRLVSRVIGHSLVNAYQINETTQNAMLLKGYEGRIFVPIKYLKFKSRDMVAFIAGISILFMAIFSNA